MIAVLGMASCTTTLNSSKTKDFSSSAITATFADLVVSPQKITYTYTPTDDVRRGGPTNVVNTAIRKALEVNGGGDVLVELQTTIKKSGRRNISEVTVSGYPEGSSTSGRDTKEQGVCGEDVLFQRLR